MENNANRHKLTSLSFTHTCLCMLTLTQTQTHICTPKHSHTHSNSSSQESTSPSQEEEINKLFDNLPKSTGYQHNPVDTTQQIRTTINKYLIPCVKFVEDIQLQYNGSIAKAVKKKLPQYAGYKIESNMWAREWKIITKFIKQECSRFKSSRIQQIGKILLCEQKFFVSFLCHKPKLTQILSNFARQQSQKPRRG